MEKERITKVTKLINDNVGEFKIQWIKGNLFLMESKNKVELTSTWYRNEKCKFYGLNRTYLESTNSTIIIKDEIENNILCEKVYLIPSSFLLELGMYEDKKNNNRPIPSISNDQINLKDSNPPHNIKRYRIL